MSQQDDVNDFFQVVCQDRDLQEKLKPPCPANRDGFVNVAHERGYTFTTVELDNYVRFYEFYKEFQAAIARHQSGNEKLSDWLKKWHKHVKRYDLNPPDDERDTIRRYM